MCEDALEGGQNQEVFMSYEHGVITNPKWFDYAMIEQNLYLGVDPGASGGFAILDSAGAIVDVSPMPDTPRDIAEYFDEFGPRIKFALIEAVHAMPGQGVTSMFTFGWNKGLLDMALIAIPHEHVLPRKWQQAFSLIRKDKAETTTDKKNRHKERAQELFPKAKITHAIADALLLAEHCRRTHK
jgi:crossover junction endodeoxyribonuclease RuvC